MQINKKADTIVVGGGAAGCMAAIEAAKQGQKVVLLEKNEKIGKKIYITGKGRCNVTNAVTTEEILKNIPVNAKFLYSAIHAFPSHQLMAFFEEAGCPLKVERGNRVFPQSDKALDIIIALEKEMKKVGVTLIKNCEVSKLLCEDGKVCGVVQKDGAIRSAKRVIVATGGLSYASTGSTGDGYRFARQVGHTIIPTCAGLVPLETKETDFCQLSPLLLKNVEFGLEVDGKTIYMDRGEVQFTRTGLGGALVLSASSFLPKSFEKGVNAWIDLKPALNKEQLDARLLREIETSKHPTLEGAFSSLLPVKMLPHLWQRCGVDPQKRTAEISKKDRQQIVKTLKRLKFQIVGVRPFKEAIITRGGINIKEINPKTMQSKKVKNLYFVGEVLDVDGLTGGYNLQIAFATGYVAGKQAIE